MALDSFFALVMLGALITYALLAGADFGAGVWDLLGSGPRPAAQRRAIAEAIGPVWEANHVWLIFFIVLLFTCFPLAYAAISTALFWPLHVVLIGIVLRGSAFVFRAYGAPTAAAQAAWGHIFGAASAVSPILLGMCLGAVSTGAIGVIGGIVSIQAGSAWRAPFAAATGILALLLCAYLAAVYLAWESRGNVQADFRRRALVTWLAAGMASVATLLLARVGAARLWDGLTSMPALGLIAAGVLLAPASAFELWRWRFGRALCLAPRKWSNYLRMGRGPMAVPRVSGPHRGWSRRTLIHPVVDRRDAAARRGRRGPSLWWLFAVFKERNPQSRGE